MPCLSAPKQNSVGLHSVSLFRQQQIQTALVDRAVKWGVRQGQTMIKQPKFFTANAPIEWDVWGGTLECFVSSSHRIDLPKNLLDSFPSKEARAHLPPLVTIDSFAILPQAESYIKYAVTMMQPIVVFIDASGPSFQFYSRGIYNGQDCGTNPNHAGLIVGYGSEGGVDYWIVKNSWGLEWGDNGYMKMQRGVGLSGACGLAMNANYPIKNS
ncbi:hypothetical protein NE237_027581 [Protea cynaroides]|uniref:Peptidase C1A papain C-terminal domain-containing protein n=1 Tax=Protea cynaroides TaxID=273540 RepID=A0A9Q0JS26_9MAGN|nr:hypothetical protein NE237_027581 [Protea cynaroides]